MSIIPILGLLLVFARALGQHNEKQNPTVCETFRRTPSKLLLNRSFISWPQRSYDEIHQTAVEDQINNYKPAKDSLDTRYTKSLNGLYDFCIDDAGEGLSAEWQFSRLRDKCRPGNLYRMPVPSAFNDIPSNATFKNYVGWFWYQRSFELSVDLAEDSRWFLQFESVNYLAIVWLQRLQPTTGETVKEPLGSHVGGHLPFAFEATDILVASSRDNNIDGDGDVDGRSRFRLTVAVSNRLTSDTIPSGRLVDLSQQVGRKYLKFVPDFDFFHFAGIMGDVNLVRLPAVAHLSSIRQVRLYDDNDSSPAIDKQLSDSTRLSFDVCVDLGHSNYEQQVVRVYMSEFAAHPYADEQMVEYSTGAIKTHRQMMELSGCTRCVSFKTQNKIGSWTLADGNPNHFSRLMRLRFEVKTKQQQQLNSSYRSDRWTSGDIEEVIAGDNRWWKNHLTSTKQQQLQGFGMHHEQLFSGRTMSQSAIMKDIYLLKQIGANVIRTSHYPYSREFLRACDENGLMVIAECPAVGLTSFSDLKLKLHKQMLREMMERDHNHVAIIAWSVANEPQSHKAQAKGYFESLADYARTNLSEFTVDADRPLTAALALPATGDQVAHTLDIIMLNYYFGWYEFLGVAEAVRIPLIDGVTEWSRKFQVAKPILLSEFGADAVAGLHSSTDEVFSEEFQAHLLIEYEKTIDELHSNTFWSNSSTPSRLPGKNETINFLGSMIWNFADFSTHESLMRVGGNKKGIFTRERNPKLAAATIREIYLDRIKTRG